MEEASSVVPAVTPTSIWVWPDPAVLLNLTCYMTGALAHLASLRQPLAAIWVSLSAQSGPAPGIAEVVDFPLLPHSSSPPPPPVFLPSIPQISISFFAVTHSHSHKPEASFLTPGDSTLKMENRWIMFLRASSSICTIFNAVTWQKNWIKKIKKAKESMSKKRRGTMRKGE